MRPGISHTELMRQRAAEVRQRREQFRALAADKNTTNRARDDAIVILHDALNSVSLSAEGEFAVVRAELGRTRRSLSDVDDSHRRRIEILTAWALLPWYRRTRKALLRMMTAGAER